MTEEKGKYVVGVINQLSNNVFIDDSIKKSWLIEAKKKLAGMSDQEFIKFIRECTPDES